MLGDFYTVLTLSLFTIIYGLAIALYSCYPLALVVLGCIPLIVISAKLTRGARLFSFVNHSYMIDVGLIVVEVQNHSDESQDAKLVSTIAAAMVQNSRSVISLGLFERLSEEYSISLFKVVKADTKGCYKVSTLSGISQFIAFAIWALAFW